MNIGICDDDKAMVEQIQKCIKRYFEDKEQECKTYVYYSGKEVILSDVDLELLFLDIDMPEMNGMETAKHIQNSQDRNKTTIVFLTSHEEEARNAFKVKAFRFILKDYFEDEIQECLNAYFKEKRMNSHIIIKKEGEEIEILQKDILYIKAKHNGSEIWTKSELYTSKRTLDNWMTKLESKIFVRCHRGGIVNLCHIDYIEDYIVMDTGEKVEISRRNKLEIKKIFHQYIFENAR